MSSINILVGAFSCTPPTMGITYRNNTGYLLNYDWLGDLYITYGLNAKVRLFYEADGSPQEEFLFYSLPNTANDFVLDFQGMAYDRIDFKFVFNVEYGAICEYTFDVPWTDVVEI